ncbi:MAG: GtrA family protein [Pseudomonadota bacterium]
MTSAPHPLTLRRLVLRYGGFAMIAILVNLAMQELVLLIGDGPVFVALAVVAGTGAGLVVKYGLDKRWIFFDQSPDLGRQFALYTVMGIATTAIFWGIVALFVWAWGSDLARITGTIFGLTIGYFVKYCLDRRFVFTDRALRIA